MVMESNPLEPTKNAEPQPSRLLLNMQDVAERLRRLMIFASKF
jgi:hypothetical protein